MIAGSVPFPLQDKSGSARNVTRLQHMETPLPDMIAIRLANIPMHWTDDKKFRVMLVPKSLIHVEGKCLEKNPEKRFLNGELLHDFIAYHSTYQMPTENALSNNNKIEVQLKQYG